MSHSNATLGLAVTSMLWLTAATPVKYGPDEPSDASKQAYALQLTVNVNLALSQLHPAVDQGRVQCGAIVGDASALAQVVQLASDPKLKSPTFNPRVDLTPAEALTWKTLSGFDAAAHYQSLQLSKDFPIANRAYQGTQAMTIGIMPQDLLDPKNGNSAYAAPGVAVHCVLFVHDGWHGAQGEWKPAKPSIVQMVPATWTNFMEVQTTSAIDTYVSAAVQNKLPDRRTTFPGGGRTGTVPQGSVCPPGQENAPSGSSACVNSPTGATNTCPTGEMATGNGSCTKMP